MDRRNYDRKALNIFDVLGSYFVDVYYNHLYLVAKDTVNQGRASNITDAYRANIINYMNGVAKRDDLYKTVACKLQEFYQKSGGFSSVTFTDFEDRVLSQFIPPEYYKDFTGQHKDKTLREIVIRTANQFGEVIVKKDMLRRIIDNHMNSANVSLLQDRILDILIYQREDYYSQFADRIASKNGADKICRATVERLKAAFVAEKKKSCHLTSENERALGIIKQLVQKISHQDAEINQMKEAMRPQEPTEVVPTIQSVQSVQSVPTISTISTIQPKDTPRKSPIIPTIPPRVDNKTPYNSPIASNSSDSSDSSESISDGEIRRRQLAAIVNLRANTGKDKPSTDSDNSTNLLGLALDDDPWAT